MSVPILILCRDRLQATEQLVEWLEQAGHENLTLIDIASTFEPLLEWLAKSPHQVVRLDENYGHRAPWVAGVVDKIGRNQPFVVTDCDVLPDPGCPLDAVEHLQKELLAHPQLIKVGLSLRLDDIPEGYAQRDKVLAWERRFFQTSLSETLWDAAVDTTFAIYRPGLDYDTSPAARTKAPYVARHLPWYIIGEPAPDEAHYLANARLGDTTWNLDDVPEWLDRHLAGLPPLRSPGRIEAKVRHLWRTKRWK